MPTTNSRCGVAFLFAKSGDLVTAIGVLHHIFYFKESAIANQYFSSNDFDDWARIVPSHCY